MKNTGLFITSLFVALGSLPGVAQQFEKLVEFPSYTSQLVRPANTMDLNPSAELVLGGDGFLYGVTDFDSYGTVFKISPSGAVTTLVQFGSHDDEPEIATKFGSGPKGALVRGGDGYFYGTTEYGGEFSHGNIFRVSPTGEFMKLVEFTGSDNENDPSRGSYPSSQMIIGADGFLYGTAAYGGTLGNGVVFKISTSGTMSTLVDFTGFDGPAKGAYPLGGLIQAPDGYFYGVTQAGGSGGDGTIFKMSPAGALETIVEFTGYSGDYKGSNPSATLTLGKDGKLYGTTSEGGEHDRGTVFCATTVGDFTTLLEFTDSEGATPGISPQEKLLEDSSGNFYGATSETIFKMSKDGDLIFLINPLDFNGEHPTALVFGGDGNLYGVCRDGNTSGNVFQMTPEGEVTVIATPSTAPVATNLPSLIDGEDGHLYGTAWTSRDDPEGGAAYEGLIYRMSSSGHVTYLAILPEPEGSHDSPQPTNLVKAGEYFYGVTRHGGDHGCGTIFKMSPEGALVTLHHFEETTNGSQPSFLTAGPDGTLYGCTNPTYDVVGSTAYGTVFKCSQSGQFETLVEFTGSTGTYLGTRPGGLLLASDGNLYGTTRRGGSHDHGTIFKIAPNGAFASLHQLHSTPGTLPSTTSWQSPAIFSQTGSFEINFEVKPNAAPMNGITGLSFGPADSYDDLACSVRLNTSGTFDARDGGTFRTDVGQQRNYYAGSTYRIRMRVDIASKSYSVWIDDELIATNFAFRTEQINATRLDRVSFRNETGSHDVSNIDLRASAKHPFSTLVEGSNGLIYGTTSSGQGERAALFRISSLGAFNVLNKLPPSLDFSLQAHPDGGFLLGGSQLIRADLAGALTTLADPSEIGQTLAFASDGAIYGISGGSIWRASFPSAPAIYESGTYPTSAQNSLLLQDYFSARGSPTTVFLDYTESSTPISDEGPFTSIRLNAIITGYLSSLSGTTLTGLLPGKTYYYRFRAENVHGSTEGRVRSFVTVGPPRLILGVADPVGSQTAKLHASVNAFNAATTASFEISESSNFTGEVRSVAVGVVNGSTDLPVSVDVSGLKKGTAYFYRIAGANALGSSTVGPNSFTTFSEPRAMTQGADFLSTTKARVHGLVTPKGNTPTARFEYRPKGSSGEAPAVPAQLGPISETGTQTATATLLNLVQGTTYEYRLVASAGSLTGEGEWLEFTLNILSGLDQEPPFDLPHPTGSLTVNLLPAGTGGWRFAGESRWRLSGESASGLASGERLVEFLPVPGYIQPPGELVEVFSGEAPVVLNAEYFLQGGTAAATGGLQVTLEPAAVRNASTPPRWRLLGIDQGSSGWRASGEIRDGLAPGSYLVECEDFPGRATPQPASIQIVSGAPKLLFLTYAERPATQDLLVQPVDATVSGDESLPFAWVGQLRGPLGTASGFAVKRRVVATAAHVVFDDATKAYVPDLQWLHQRHAGINEPVPQTPRGFFLPTAYEAERSKPGIVPGEGTDRSQHYDYAALYFLNDVARSGFSGFLASEGDENEFLTDPDSPEPSQKILAGYATDIANPADRGKLHATPFTGSIPAFSLTQVAGTIEEVVGNVTQHVAHGTYTTTAVSGRAGCSGGPLFVRHANGSFYPAAIYIGDSGPGIGTIVRGIDRKVVELFGLAETRSYGGGNSTDGGKTLTTTSLGTATERGALKVVLLPAGLPGAGWRLLPGTTVRDSGYQRDRLRKGTYRVWIAPVEGYVTPMEETVTITAGELLTFTYTYQSALTPQQSWRQAHFGSPDNTGPGADTADPDGDGTTNLDEYAAGSDPKNPTDFFRVNSSTRGPTSFTVNLTGKKDRTYTLQRRDAISGTWVPILPATGPLPADNAAIILTDPSPPAASGMYRVSVTLP